MGVKVLDDGIVIIEPGDDATKVEEKIEDLSTAVQDLSTAISDKPQMSDQQELLELCRTQSQQISDLIQQQTALSNELASIREKLSETARLIEPSIQQANEILEDMAENSVISAQMLENSAQDPTLVLAETIDTNEISTEASSSTETELQDESAEGQKDTLLVEPVAPQKHRVMMY